MCQRFLLGAALIFAMALTPRLEADQPNIVFIFTDDHRHALLGIVNDQIQTPRMDELARTGVFFRNAFVTTSRASTMTGRYGNRNGVTGLSQRIRATEVTFAQLLRDQGYRTALVGKWHVRNKPLELGWDSWAYFHNNGSWFQRPIHSNIRGRRRKPTANHEANHGDRPFVLWLCNQIPHLDGNLSYPASEESLRQ